MLTEYAGWQISDDRQREIEEQIRKHQLVEAARAGRGWQPAWLRVQLHRVGVRLVQVGEQLQIQAEQCTEVVAGAVAGAVSEALQESSSEEPHVA